MSICRNLNIMFVFMGDNKLDERIISHNVFYYNNRKYSTPCDYTKGFRKSDLLKYLNHNEKFYLIKNSDGYGPVYICINCEEVHAHIQNLKFTK